MSSGGKGGSRATIIGYDYYASFAGVAGYGPVEALVEGDGQKGYVFLADRNAGRVTRLPVRVAAILNDQLLVESGLQEGQEIVTFGSSYLHENSAVEFVDNPPVSQH